MAQNGELQVNNRCRTTTTYNFTILDFDGFYVILAILQCIEGAFLATGGHILAPGDHILAWGQKYIIKVL